MKKMNNKGFSLVELIIVIAIMAILAGALAPALIKYIAKSRRSSDANNCGTIQSSMQTAMSDEDADTDAPTAGGGWQSIGQGGGSNFWSKVDEDLSGGTAAFANAKTTKTATGGKCKNGVYVYSVDANQGFHVGVSFPAGVTGGSDTEDDSSTHTFECVPTLNAAMK